MLLRLQRPTHTVLLGARAGLPIAAALALLLWSRAAPALPVPVSPLAQDLPGPGKGTRPSLRELQAALQEALAKGRRGEAREIVNRILEEPYIDSDELLRTGIALAEQELYTEASRTFSRCVRDYPQLFECRYDLALADLALGKNTEGLAALEKVSNASADERVALTYLRGKIEAAMGEDHEAERDLSDAFKRAPDQANYALDLGLLYTRLRAYQKASEVFERGAKYHDDVPLLRLGLGLAQYLAGHYAESVVTCQDLLERQPDFSSARVLLAWVLSIQGELQEAKQVAAVGLQIPSPSPYLYYLHAITLLKLNSKQYGQMQQDLQHALAAVPSCTLCYLAMGKVHQRVGDFAAATEDLEKAVSMDPSFIEAWYQLAAVYDRTGRHSEALRAREHLDALRKEKTDRETEVMQKEIIRALGEATSSQSSY